MSIPSSSAFPAGWTPPAPRKCCTAKAGTCGPLPLSRDGLRRGGGRARPVPRPWACRFEVIDARAELERYVCRPFAEAYKRGETPSPCVLCNPEVKLRLLCEYADGWASSTSPPATTRGPRAGRSSWADRRTTRAICSAASCPISSDACSCPSAAWPKPRPESWQPRSACPPLRSRTVWSSASFPTATMPPGWSSAGTRPGRGISSITALPSQGTAASTASPSASAGAWATPRESEYYVSEIRPGSGEVVLADGDGLFSDEVAVRDMRWLVPEPEAPFDCQVRVRHSRTLAPARPAPRPAGRSTSFPKAPCARPRPARPRRCTWTAGCSAAASSPPQGLMIQRIQNRYNYN